MGISLLSAVIVGLIIGALARLVLPGRQNIGVIWTIVIGIVAALIGAAIGGALGLNNDGFNVITLIIQVVLAVVGVAAIAGRKGARR